MKLDDILLNPIVYELPFGPPIHDHLDSDNIIAGIHYSLMRRYPKQQYLKQSNYELPVPSYYSLPLMPYFKYSNPIICLHLPQKQLTTSRNTIKLNSPIKLNSSVLNNLTLPIVATQLLQIIISHR